MKVFYLVPQSEIDNVVKNKSSSHTEIAKSTLLNNVLPPNKILDIYSNINRINREKSESNKEMIELDGKKLNVDKQTSEKMDTEGNIKVEEKSKFIEWYAINSIVNSLPLIARKDAVEFLELLLKQKHIVLNENFTITNLKSGIHIEIHDLLKGIFVIKASIKNNRKFFDDIMEYIPHKIIRNVKLLNSKDNDDVDVSYGGNITLKNFKWILF